MAKTKLEKTIEADLENFKKKWLDTAARKIMLEIGKQYVRTIDSFYKSYSPRFYDRTYSTYLAGMTGKMGKGIPRGKIGVAPNKRRITFQIDSSNIPDGTYRADSDWVFHRTFDLGYHGFAEITGDIGEAFDKHKRKGVDARRVEPPRSASHIPLTVFTNRFNRIKNNQRIYGEHAAMGKLSELSTIALASVIQEFRNK